MLYMVVKVKKNKTPKASKSKGKPIQKGRHGTAGSVKQSVTQNVKVNIYKPKSIPKQFKVSTQNKGAVPNIKELPQSVFHQPVFKPTLTLYNETFGDATRQISASPFERQLASLAVQDNRELETAKLQNTLESSRLKAVEREPIQRPSFVGESEQDRFMARATASTNDNREPFRVVDVNDATTLGVSRKDRLTEADKLDMAEKRRIRFQAPPNAIRNSLARAEEELETGQANTGEGESQTFRSQAGATAEDYTIIDTQQAEGDYSGLPLGEPSIPNRLVSFVAETGTTPEGAVLQTAGDFLRERRGEYAPITEGVIDAEQIALEARRRGRTPTRTDEKGIKGREATARSRLRAKSQEDAPALKARGRPKKALGGQPALENFFGSSIGGV